MPSFERRNAQVTLKILGYEPILKVWANYYTLILHPSIDQSIYYVSHVTLSASLLVIMSPILRIFGLLYFIFCVHFSFFSFALAFAIFIRFPMDRQIRRCVTATLTNTYRTTYPNFGCYSQASRPSLIARHPLYICSHLKPCMFNSYSFIYNTTSFAPNAHYIIYLYIHICICMLCMYNIQILFYSYVVSYLFRNRFLAWHEFYNIYFILPLEVGLVTIIMWVRVIIDFDLFFFFFVFVFFFVLLNVYLFALTFIVFNFFLLFIENKSENISESISLRKDQ